MEINELPIGSYVQYIGESEKPINGYIWQAYIIINPTDEK